MRVVSEWNYKQLKVTVFHMNEKYSLKVEDNLLEQTYKFREGQVESLEQLNRILNETFFEKCISLFADMQASRSTLLKVEDEDLEFEEII